MKWILLVTKLQLNHTTFVNQGTVLDQKWCTDCNTLAGNTPPRCLGETTHTVSIGNLEKWYPLVN